MSESIQPINRLFKLAVMTGVVNSVRLHIERGDDLNARDDKGFTLLMIAASRNKAEVCSLLLSANADHTLLDPSGRDALTIAKMSGCAQSLSVIEAAISTLQNLSIAAPASIQPDALPSLDFVEVSAPTAFESYPIFQSTIAPENPIDEFGWDAEEETPPPSDDPLLVAPAVAIHNLISEHAPIDNSSDWSSPGAELPSFAAPIIRVEDVEHRNNLKTLLTRALREGSVPSIAIEDLCLMPDRTINVEAEQILKRVVNDLGAEYDERFEYKSHDENFTVFVSPVLSAEVDAVDELLHYFDSFQDDPSLTHSARDINRELLLTAHEEIALAQTMEEGTSAALDALAAWPFGISSLVEDCFAVAKNLPELELILAIDAGFDPQDDASVTSDELGDDQEMVNQDSSSLLLQVKEISLMPQSNSIKDENWRSIRNALTNLSIQKPYLLTFLEKHERSEHASEKLFAKALLTQRQARDRMTLSNLRLVKTVAKRYRRSGMELDDLIQEGNIGLLKGIDKFDWRKGFRFATYATWWIRQQISRSVMDSSRAIRLPVHLHKQVMQIDQAAQAWDKEHRAPPSPSQLAEALGIPLRKVEAILRGTEQPIPLETCGIDQMISPDISWNFIQPDPSIAAESMQLRKRVEAVLADLGTKNGQIIRLRYGIGLNEELTLEEVGSLFDLTRERIRQIEAKTLRLLQNPSRSRLLMDWTIYKKKTGSPGETKQLADKQKSNEIDTEDGDDCGGQEAKPTHLPRTLSQALESLLKQAESLGIVVEDDRANPSGQLWVRVHSARDTTTRVLIRRLMQHGFTYSSGLGYFR